MVTCIAAAFCWSACDSEESVEDANPSSVPTESTAPPFARRTEATIGWPDILALAAFLPAAADVRLRDLDDDPFEVEDHASELVGGGGKSCATTVACDLGARWRTACSSDWGSLSS